MNYKIVATRNFEKELKHLAKKYPSLKNDLQDLNSKLFSNPRLGTPLGNDSYKIRLAVKSKGKGKRGGMRVITYLHLDIIIRSQTNIYLLSIYDKSEIDTISKDEIKLLIESVLKEYLP